MKTKISPVTLKVRGLPQGNTPILLAFDAESLDYPDFRGMAEMKGIITRQGDRIELKGEVSTEGEFECTRCADPFSGKILATLKLEFVPERLTPNEGDPNIHTYDPLADSEVDILPDMRDALIVAVPMRHLCKPDCKGLCPNCGANWNRGHCDCPEEKEASGGWTALNSLRERLRAEENFNNN